MRLDEKKLTRALEAAIIIVVVLFTAMWIREVSNRSLRFATWRLWMMVPGYVLFALTFALLHRTRGRLGLKELWYARRGRRVRGRVTRVVRRRAGKAGVVYLVFAAYVLRGKNHTASSGELTAVPRCRKGDAVAVRVLPGREGYGYILEKDALR